MAATPLFSTFRHAPAQYPLKNLPYFAVLPVSAWESMCTYALAGVILLNPRVLIEGSTLYLDRLGYQALTRSRQR